MKRIAILVMLLSLVFSGCIFRRKTNYEFLHSTDQIVSIDILDNDDHNPLLEDEPDPKVLCVISEDEFDSVISTLANIPGNEFLNDPPEGYGPVVIRITYSNGDFELIGRHNSSVHLASGRIIQKTFCLIKRDFVNSFLSMLMNRNSQIGHKLIPGSYADLN